jgi:hypothetical protein
MNRVFFGIDAPMRFHAALKKRLCYTQDALTHRLSAQSNAYAICIRTLPSVGHACRCLFVCSLRSIGWHLFALRVVELLLVELCRPHRLFIISKTISTLTHINSTHLTLLLTNIRLEVLAIRPLTRPIMPTLVIRRTAYITLVLALTNSSQQLDMRCQEDTRTALASSGGGVCGRAAASREAVFYVLYALRLVGVWEPVLAHEEVVAEADGAASHEDFRDGEW